MAIKPIDSILKEHREREINRGLKPIDSILSEHRERELQTAVDSLSPELRESYYRSPLRPNTENLIQSQFPNQTPRQSSLDSLPQEARDSLRLSNTMTPEKVIEVDRMRRQPRLEAMPSQGVIEGERLDYRGNTSLANRIVKPASDFTVRALDEAAFNLPSRLSGHNVKEATSDTLGKVGGTASDIAGLLLGFGGAYKATKGLADGLAKGGLGRQVSRELMEQGVYNPTIAREMIRGGIASGAYSATDELLDTALDTRQDGRQSLGKRLENVATETAFGALGDAAFAGLGTGLGRLIRRGTQTPSEPLALPEPRQRGNINRAETPDVINVEETSPRGLPEPSQAAVNRVENVQSAREELATINQAIKSLDSSYEKAIEDQYQFLLKSRDSRGGVKQGGPMLDQDGYMIGLVGRESNNPQWYRDFYEQYNRVPTNADLRRLAKEHIDKGFQDDAAFVPPWKEQVNFDEQMTALKSARDTIRQSVRELDNTVQRTNAVLRDSAVRANASQPNRVGSTATDTLNINTRQTADNVTEATTVRQEPPVSEAVQGQPRIRDRIYDFLDEQERAARERLAKSRNRLSSTPIDVYRDYAIIGAAKLGKGTIKFADWSEEMVKEFGEQIRPQLQRIYRQSREELRRAERLASKEGKKAAEFNAGGGNAKSFDQKISWEPTNKRRSFSELVEKVRTQLIDDVAPFEILEKSIRGKLSSAEDSLYKTARLFKGAPERANNIIQTRLVPIVNKAKKAGYSAEDLARYSLARHARDVNNAGYISGFTNREIDDVISKLGSRELESLRKELVKVSDDMLQMVADSGRISQELVDTLRERWPNYMPMFRQLDDDKIEFASGLSNALVNAQMPFSTLKGSQKQVINPLENMVRNIFQSVNSAERNNISKQFLKLAKDDVAGKFIRRLDPNESIGRKNVIKVYEGGNEIRLEVPPAVYEAAMNLDRESLGILTKIFQAPASLLRAGATLTPEFSLRNWIRDVPMAYVTSNSGFNPITDFTVGLIQSISKGKLYRQWLNDLGGYGNIISMDRKVHRDTLRKVLGESPSKKFVNVVSGRSFMRLLREIADVSESATKLGEYRAALRKGVSRQEAAYRSRDVMDFARAGSKMRNLNRVVAFLNANIQGKSKLWRAFKEDTMGVMTRAFTAVTLPTIAAFIMQKYMANDRQKTLIEDSPNWLKDTFWLIPIPNSDQVARIPKPFDLAPIFSNLAEHSLDFVYKNDKQAFDGFVERSFDSMALPYQLTGLLPIIEGMSNYSFFREGPIIPMSEQNRNYSDQYGVNTTETAKFLAGVMERVTGGRGPFKNFSSPRIVDNTIRGFTAGLGTYGTNAIDYVLDKTGAIDRPARPANDISQQPLLRAFLVNQNSSGQSMNDLYELRDQLTRERGSARLNNERFTDEGKYKFVNDQTSKMGEITKKIREIENSRKLSSEDKLERISKLIERRNEIARKAMERIRKAP